MLEEGRYWDDDGNRLYPENYPKPGLCIICKKNDGDEFEEILCNLHRLDFVDGQEEFTCGVYVPLEV